MTRFDYYHHSHNKQIVRKHRPNWLFYAFMLRTKLYQNPFFFIGHQNVNKPKSRAKRTVYRLIFLTFYKIIFSFFLFYVKCKQNNIKLCYNGLSKKHKLTLYKIENRESNYADHKFLFNFYKELPTCTKPWDRHPNTIELASCLVHVLCDFKAT